MSNFQNNAWQAPFTKTHAQWCGWCPREQLCSGARGGRPDSQHSAAPLAAVRPPGLTSATCVTSPNVPWRADAHGALRSVFTTQMPYKQIASQTQMTVKHREIIVVMRFEHFNFASTRISFTAKLCISIFNKLLTKFLRWLTVIPGGLAGAGPSSRP